MTVIVETYHDPLGWKRHPAYGSIKKGIHLCATKNIADGIKERYRNDGSGEFQHIFTIHELMRGVLSGWYKPESMLIQYLNLSREIHRLHAKKEIKKSFLKNAAELLETIRFLSFCGVKPESLSSHWKLAEIEEVFRVLWRNFRINNPEAFEFIESFVKGNYRWKRKKIIRSLNKIHEKRFESGDEEKKLEIGDDQKDIILHGFYFITPEQQVFLKFLERSGFNLVYFQYYDDRYPNTFDFQKNFISARQGWTDDWNIQKNLDKEVTHGHAFLKSFEDGGDAGTPSGSIPLKSYDSFFDFLQQVVMRHFPIGVGEGPVDVQIIATNADILNSMLVKYYPEKYAGRRNFLNYPVGQFILKIHEMRDGDRLVLNEDILMTAFASGWLVDKVTYENAKDYTYDLEMLFPFFKGCESIDEWKARMESLLDIYAGISPLFETAEGDGIHESVKSPFEKIAHFSLPKRRVEQIRRFIGILEGMASRLFDMGSDETTIDGHFERLRSLMKENNPIANKVLLQEEEKRLLGILQSKIDDIRADQPFLYEDIGTAINYYLSGKFSDEEDHFIKPFIEVDGEVFKCGKRKVYLTGLDEQGLPLGEFSLPWPLQKGTFEILAVQHPPLQLHLLRNESVKKISRYLLYISLEFLDGGQLELSWIRNFLDREDLEPSVYVNFLNVDVVSNGSREDDNGMDETVSVQQNPVDAVDIPGNMDSGKDGPGDDLVDSIVDFMHDDVLVEYKLCPKRFQMGFVHGKYSVFNNDFLHQFQFPGILNLVRKVANDDEKAFEQVSRLFPQWNDYHKRNMASGYRPRNPDVIEIKKALLLPGLKKKSRDGLYQKVSSDKDEIIKELKNALISDSGRFEAYPGHHCIFCPFLDHCKDGLYPLNKQNEGGTNGYGRLADGG